MRLGQAVRGGDGVPDLQLQTLDARLRQAGHFGYDAASPGGRDPDGLELATLDLGHGQAGWEQRHLDLVAQHAGDDLRVARVGHMHRRNAGLGLEQFHAQVRHRADAGGTVIPAVTGAAGFGQEIGGGGPGGTSGCGQHQRRHRQQGHRLQVLERIVGCGRVQDPGNREVAIDHQADGVIVGGAGHLVGGDVTAGTRPVFHHHRLAQRLRQRLGDGTGHEVWRRTGGKAHQNLQRLARPGDRLLRPGGHGDASGQRHSGGEHLSTVMV